MEMSDKQVERLVQSFELIGKSLDKLSKCVEKGYEGDYTFRLWIRGLKHLESSEGLGKIADAINKQVFHTFHK